MDATVKSRPSTATAKRLKLLDTLANASQKSVSNEHTTLPKKIDRSATLGGMTKTMSFSGRVALGLSALMRESFHIRIVPSQIAATVGRSSTWPRVAHPQE